jgi:hypothetical protein
VANAKSFDGRMKSGTGDWQPTQSFAGSRDILFPDLTPGMHTLQLCAIGGSTGASDWSSPVWYTAM